MKGINWIKAYPLTAIMIVAWFAGASFFGSDRLYKWMEDMRYAPRAREEMSVMKGLRAYPRSLFVVDRQNTSEDKEAAERAAAQAAEEERRKHPFSKVEESYLDDAVFIGDSRTDTLRLYAGWDNASYYVKTGTNIWSILEDVISLDGENISIEKALKKNKFGKIYIMLGINELSNGTAESFYQEFKTVVGRLRELQPEAIIFVESIMHISSSVQKSGRGFDNEAINSRNKLLKKLADNDMIYYIDENEALDDKDGCLTGEYTYDGIHLQAKYVQPWKDFILEHGVVK